MWTRGVHDLHPRGGCRRGAEMRFREGISVCTELDGRVLPVSPRYQIERSTK